MNCPDRQLEPPDTALHWIERALGDLAGRLAGLLRASEIAAAEPVAAAIGALERRAEAAPGAPGPLPPGIIRLAEGLRLDALDLDLLLLAAMAEHDEASASILSLIHPTGRPWPTVGLAERLFCDGMPDRRRLRERITQGALIRSGAISCTGDGPLSLRDLQIESAVWTLLLGGTALLPALQDVPGRAVLDGLDGWLASDECEWARSCLRAGRACTVMIAASDAETAFHRGLALCSTAGIPHRALGFAADAPRGGAAAALSLQSLVEGLVPILRVAEEASLPDAAALAGHPGPLIFAGRTGTLPDPGERAAIRIEVASLPLCATESMWMSLAPDLGREATALAARFPLEPFRAAHSVRDLRFRGGPASADALSACIKARAARRIPRSADLVHPVAGWPQLILPETQIAQLRDAVHRLHAQARVLGEWRFLADRRGARGVRLMFAGPPGTGKTLAAEVLARALGADLLVVDLSRVVSKWVGETEKNLAEVFDAAEEVRAVLFFDEAEALFGKRTEASDAQDRFANLETAYLLSRIERYDGLAVMATNFRRNLDAAFVRRLDYILEFREPSVEERAALWRAHLPDAAPLAGDVDLVELARLYPMVGGQIRNACLSAAYFAASERTDIAQAHLLRGARREYEKTGKAFREVAPDRNP